MRHPHGECSSCIRAILMNNSGISGMAWRRCLRKEISPQCLHFSIVMNPTGHEGAG